MSKLRKWLAKEERAGSCAVIIVDPSIKLFGATIAVTAGGGNEHVGEVIADRTISRQTRSQESSDSGAGNAGEEPVQNREDRHSLLGMGIANELGGSEGGNGPAKAEEEEESLTSSKEGSDSTVTTAGTETVAVAAAESEGGSMKHKEDEGGYEIGSQGKTLKKPDKRSQCPRCERLDTKFCYYNNYNVNQPRHFCKNCQRYWTAGGTLRNVPVGAGRRKSKHVGLQACHGAAADGSVISITRPDSQESVQQLLPCPVSRISHLKHPQIPGQCPILPSLDSRSGGSTVATFYQSSGLSEGAGFLRHATGKTPPQPYACSNPLVASGGEISLMGGFQVSGNACQKLAVNGTQNGVSATDEVPSKVEKKEDVDECTSPVSQPISIATQEAVNTGGPMLLDLGIQPDVGGSYRPISIRGSGHTGGPFGFYNGAWPYGFNVGWTGAIPGASPRSVGPGQLLPGNGMAMLNPPPNGVWARAGVLPWASPIPGMPGCPWVIPPSWGGGWTVPLPWAASAAASTTNGSVLPTSKLPGMTTPLLGKHPREQPEGRTVDGALWAPKTLKIDDPKKAVRSSVWNALGMPIPPDSVLSGVCSENSN